MKKTFLIIATLFVTIATTFAQKPEEVLQSYIKAIGGTEAIAAISDIKQTMSAEVQGTTIEVVATKKVGGKSLQVTSVAGMGEMNRVVCDGTKASTTSQQGSTPVEGDLLKLTIAQSAVIAEVEYLKSSIVKMALEGKEKVGESEAYKISMDAGAMKWVDFYDVASGLKVKTVTTLESPMGSMESIMTYKDYKAVSGVLMPMSIVNETSMFTMDLKAIYEVNKGVADAEFEVK